MFQGILFRPRDIPEGFHGSWNFHVEIVATIAVHLGGFMSMMAKSTTYLSQMRIVDIGRLSIAGFGQFLISAVAA